MMWHHNSFDASSYKRVQAKDILVMALGERQGPDCFKTKRKGLNDWDFRFRESLVGKELWVTI